MKAIFTHIRYHLGWSAVWLLLVIISFSLYWPAITSGLLSDDWGLSMPSANPWVSLYSSWFGGTGGYFYRPISRLALFYEARIFGYSGYGQHIVSQLLFLATVALTAIAVRRASGMLGAFICALLLITSPVAASVVSWVSSQTDLLVGLFMALAIIPVLYRPSELPLKTTIISLISGLAAYMSKESAAALGPLALVYLAYLAVSHGPQGLLRLKKPLMLVAGHLILMTIYLLFRLWRFGQVGIGDPAEFEPALGWIWHSSQLFHTAMRDFFLPLSGLFPAVASSNLSAGSSLWTVLLMAVLMLVSFIQGQRLAAFVLLGFMVALIPHLISSTPYFYPETGMTDVRRYLYIPMFFLTAYVGITLGRIRGGTGSVLLVVVFLAYLQAQLAQQRIVDYKLAGQFREKLIEQLTTTFSQVPGEKTIVVERLPDKKGEAYLFRNGIQEMVSVLFPGVPVVFNAAEAVGRPPDSTFILSSEGSNEPVIKRMSQVFDLRAQVQQSGQTASPMILDTRTGQNSLNRLRHNEDIQMVETKPDLLLNLTGPDPVLLLPPLRSQPYYLYKEVVITLEFLDVPESGKTGELQFLWALKSDNNPASFPYITKVVEIKPGLQTVIFDLHSQPTWFRPGEVAMARIDLPETYRGRVRVTTVGIR